MKAICLHSKQEIEAYLRRDTFLHIYSIGDLDNFFWQYTTWYALLSLQQEISAIALLYSGVPVPVLLALSEEPGDDMGELLQSISHLLPRHFHAHLSGDRASIFADDYAIQSFGPHYKMALIYKERVDAIDTSRIVALTTSDLPALQALYRASYPLNAFDPRMLETGHYYGIRHGSDIISVAGVHVYSQRYRVAALGNVTTHPEFRGQGFGTAVCAKLCQSLLRTIDHIGLNVKADNTSAIAVYKNLGFEVVAAYGEYEMEAK
ncbi:MAG TPA: GNAT family N-acetyltransferase [Ktedonobacteraceae bacterium]|jgi:ribosomal protein S18 acetylase RimI-like enzyme|nr:GNAT family N-acetyltransferase [Ktedonobacteraceae bacterium]